jgi:hypothetical protein
LLRLSSEKITQLEDLVQEHLQNFNMKFGHNLPRNQVPEWASAYIDYKGLKKLIKAAALRAKETSSVDLAGMFDIYIL